MPIQSRQFSKEEVLFIDEWFDVYIDLGLIRWAKKRHHRPMGSMAGETKPMRRHGDLKVRVNGRLCAVHRVIFWVARGELPEMIDHIDRNPSNNSISNLRACNATENARNRKSDGCAYRADQKTGNKWRAYIGVDGKRINLGQFRTRPAAIAARKAAELKYFGEFAPANGCMKEVEPCAPASE